MFIPSGKLWNRMCNEKVGLFFEESLGDFSHGVVVKIPMFSIKNIINGCDVYFTLCNISVDGINVVCSRIIIKDDINHPLFVFTPHRTEYEQKCIKEMLAMESVPIHFFDELSMNIASATTSFESIKHFGFFQTKVQHKTIDRTIANAAIDTLENATDELQITNKIKNTTNIVELNSMKIKLKELVINKIDYIGNDGVKVLSLNEIEEGYISENAVWTLIENIFSPNIFHSPYYLNKNLKTELTDILALSDRGLILFESKCAAVLDSKKQQPSIRKSSNIKKQIYKAISQLKGVTKNIYSGVKIYSTEDKEINVSFYNMQFKHAIIVISDFFPGINWEEIAQDLITASKSTKFCFSILDLMELRLLVGAGDSAPLFHLNLLNIFENMYESGTALIKGRYLIDETDKI